MLAAEHAHLRAQPVKLSPLAQIRVTAIRGAAAWWTGLPPLTDNWGSPPGCRVRLTPAGRRHAGAAPAFLPALDHFARQPRGPPPPLPGESGPAWTGRAGPECRRLVCSGLDGGCVVPG